MSPAELLEVVVDKDSFIAFVQALADEREEAQHMEQEDPVRYQLGGAKDWQNGDIASYLYACLDYFEDQPFHKPDEVPSWRMLAEVLYCGKIIE